MNDSKISVRYAKALFETAADRKLLNEVRQDMVKLKEICKIEEFDSFLNSPIIKNSKKCSIVHEILRDKVQPITITMLDLLFSNGRELYIPGIARNYESLYKKHSGIKSVLLTSAYALDSSTTEKIGEILKNSLNTKVEIVTAEDESLIGGFVIRIDDQQYDTSVANKLRKIKKQLLN